MTELSERIRRNVHDNMEGWVKRLLLEAADEIDRLSLFERYSNRDIHGQVENAIDAKKNTGKYPFED